MITEKEFELARKDKRVFYFVKTTQFLVGCLIGLYLAKVYLII